MSGASAGIAVRFRRLRPEPTRFWLSRVPVAWSHEAVPWTDLATGRLGRSTDPARVGPWPPENPDALTYLPPGSGDAPAGAGATLRQLLPGQRLPEEPSWVVWDLLPALLARDLEAFDTLDGGSAAWPLVPGLTDGEALREEALPLLAAAGVRHLQPVLLETEPGDKRRLAAYGDEGAFTALFHGAAPDERAFSQHAARWGMKPFARRPASGLAPRSEGNARLAGELLLAGELWLRCGRPEVEGQALLRAGRWVDETEHDVAALTREGNLDVVPSLDETSRRVLAESVEDVDAQLVTELEEEYLRPGADG